MVRHRGSLASLALLALLLPSSIAQAQRIDSVTVEQRVLMTPELTPAEARRRAIDGALAEAVRRAAGVRVQSSALSTLDDVPGGAVHGGYSSVIQLDAAARAVDYRVLDEEWETLRPAGVPPQLYLRLRLVVTVQGEAGTPDAAFQLELSLNATRFDVRAGPPGTADEIIATIRASQASYLVLFTVADDSVLRLFPNEYVRDIRAAAGTPLELPDPEWRARGLRLRATLPSGRTARREFLVVVATRTAVPPPPAALSVVALQRWLVRIPLGDRTIAFAPYEVRRAP